MSSTCHRNKPYYCYLRNSPDNTLCIWPNSPDFVFYAQHSTSAQGMFELAAAALELAEGPPGDHPLSWCKRLKVCEVAEGHRCYKPGRQKQLQQVLVAADPAHPVGFKTGDFMGFYLGHIMTTAESEALIEASACPEETRRHADRIFSFTAQAPAADSHLTELSQVVKQITVDGGCFSPGNPLAEVLDYRRLSDDWRVLEDSPAHLNAALLPLSNNRTGKIYLAAVALCDIPIGTEITFDYGLDYITNMRDLVVSHTRQVKLVAEHLKRARAACETLAAGCTEQQQVGPLIQQALTILAAAKQTEQLPTGPAVGAEAAVATPTAAAECGRQLQAQQLADKQHTPAPGLRCEPAAGSSSKQLYCAKGPSIQRSGIDKTAGAAAATGTTAAPQVAATGYQQHEAPVNNQQQSVGYYIQGSPQQYIVVSSGSSSVQVVEEHHAQELESAAIDSEPARNGQLAAPASTAAARVKSEAQARHVDTAMQTSSLKRRFAVVKPAAAAGVDRPEQIPIEHEEVFQADVAKCREIAAAAENVVAVQAAAAPAVAEPTKSSKQRRLEHRSSNQGPVPDGAAAAAGAGSSRAAAAAHGGAVARGDDQSHPKSAYAGSRTLLKPSSRQADIRHTLMNLRQQQQTLQQAFQAVPASRTAQQQGCSAAVAEQHRLNHQQAAHEPDQVEAALMQTAQKQVETIRLLSARVGSSKALRSALLELAKLADEGQEGQTATAAAGAIPVAVQLLGHNIHDIKEVAAGVLTNIAAEQPALQRAVAGEGGIVKLVDLAELSVQLVCKLEFELPEAVALALVAVIGDLPELTDAAVDAGVIKPLLQLAGNINTTSDLLRSVCSLLQKMTRHSAAGAASFVEAGGVKQLAGKRSILHRTLSSDGFWEARTAAITTLANVLYHCEDQNQAAPVLQEFRHSGTMDRVVDWLLCVSPIHVCLGSQYSSCKNLSTTQKQDLTIAVLSLLEQTTYHSPADADALCSDGAMLQCLIALLLKTETSYADQESVILEKAASVYGNLMNSISTESAAKVLRDTGGLQQAVSGLSDHVGCCGGADTTAGALPVACAAAYALECLASFLSQAMAQQHEAQLVLTRQAILRNIPAIIQLLHTSSACNYSMGQAKAVKALAGLLKCYRHGDAVDGSAARLIFKLTDAVEVLENMLESPNGYMQLTAGGLLRAMTHAVAVWLEKYEPGSMAAAFGMIQKLANMLKQGARITQQQVACALENLISSTSPTTQVLQQCVITAAATAIPALVEIASYEPHGGQQPAGDLDAASAAAHLIGMLASNTTNMTTYQADIAGAGGIEVLVSILSRHGAPGAVGDQSDRLAVHASWALNCLTFKNKSNQDAVAAAGILPLLVDVVKQGNASELQQNAVQVLNHLAEDNAAIQLELAASGVRLVLGPLIKDGTTVQLGSKR